MSETIWEERPCGCRYSEMSTTLCGEHWDALMLRLEQPPKTLLHPQTLDRVALLSHLRTAPYLGGHGLTAQARGSMSTSELEAMHRDSHEHSG